MEFGSGAFEGPYSFQSRMEEGPGTNPEELLGAAHAGCFSMALSGVLAADGHAPESISTDAKVRFDKQGEGWAITSVELTTRARVPGIDEDGFRQAAETAKVNCPVSQALGDSVEVTLNATLDG
jgi:osmotically inducible protein OsmC